MSIDRQQKYFEPGTVLENRFKVIKFLGAGSFGEVYQTKQLVYGHPLRTVALKLFSEGVITTDNAYNILNDAIVLSGLQEEEGVSEAAKGFVQLYDIGILRLPQERAFMTMKFIPGHKTLGNEIRRFGHLGGMPVSLSLRYLYQILKPLAWMHSLETSLVHGDLKPENILLTDDHSLVLTDFGLATRMPAGTFGGTIPYDAPEKFYGRVTAGPAADIYAVAIIWYEMLTGKHPFEMVGLEELANKDNRGYFIAHRESRKWNILPESIQSPDEQRIVPVSELNQDLAENHPQIEAVLNRCFAYDVSKRYPNAKVLLADIEKYINKGHISSNELKIIDMSSNAQGTSQTTIKEREKTTEDKLADANAFMIQGKHEKALDLAEKILHDLNNFVPAILLKAKGYIKLDRVDEAFTLAADAKKLEPQNPEVFDVMAEIYDAQKKNAMAQMLRIEASKLRNLRSNVKRH